jgi:hypothetical protein
VGIVETVREDGTPVDKSQKNTPEKQQQARRKTKRKTIRKPKATYAEDMLIVARGIRKRFSDDIDAQHNPWPNQQPTE